MSHAVALIWNIIGVEFYIIIPQLNRDVNRRLIYYICGIICSVGKHVREGAAKGGWLRKQCQWKVKTGSCQLNSSQSHFGIHRHTGISESPINLTTRACIWSEDLDRTHADTGRTWCTLLLMEATMLTTTPPDLHVNQIVWPARTRLSFLCHQV